MQESTGADILFEKVEELEKTVTPRGEEPDREKIAVFDLDNTLLTGDIGDALFAQLLIDKAEVSLTWRGYRDLIAAGKKREAYEKVVTAMAGLTVATVVETTRRVMSSGVSFLKLPEADVPVPAPHPVMRELLKFLKTLNYSIYVISASNHYSVRFVACTYFDLPESHVFGIKQSVRKNQDAAEGSDAVLGDTLIPPVTISEGKAEVYRETISKTPPLITAGDSGTDIPMLNLVASPGLAIWVGCDEKKYRAVEEKIDYPGNLFFFRR